MNTRMLNRCALASPAVVALALGGFAVATPAMAQVGPYSGPYSGPYYDYAPGYAPYYDYAPGYGPGPGPWGTIIANSNPSVVFDPGDAALSYRYGRDYGYCGFTITGC